MNAPFESTINATFCQAQAWSGRVEARDPELYAFPVESRTRRLFAQYLFSYKFKPQTVLFLGYSDTSTGAATTDLERQNRTFFVKLGYAWIL